LPGIWGHHLTEFSVLSHSKMHVLQKHENTLVNVLQINL